MSKANYVIVCSYEGESDAAIVAKGYCARSGWPQQLDIFVRQTYNWVVGYLPPPLGPIYTEVLMGPGVDLHKRVELRGPGEAVTIAAFRLLSVEEARELYPVRETNPLAGSYLYINNEAGV